MDVGFIGLGSMGSAMAANLVKAGHRVRGWNRSGDGGVAGIEMVATPNEAFASAVVFTMLSDDDAIREVLLEPGVIDGARAGTVHVVTSTISVAFVRELVAAHRKAGVGYVAAPVLGRPDVAKTGQLNILVGGEAAAIETARPLLNVLAKKLWPMGTNRSTPMPPRSRPT